MKMFRVEYPREGRNFLVMAKDGCAAVDKVFERYPAFDPVHLHACDDFDEVVEMRSYVTYTNR